MLFTKAGKTVMSKCSIRHLSERVGVAAIREGLNARQQDARVYDQWVSWIILRGRFFDNLRANIYLL